VQAHDGIQLRAGFRAVRALVHIDDSLRDWRTHAVIDTVCAVVAVNQQVC
jgi:hypothetical protein